MTRVRRGPLSVHYILFKLVISLRCSACARLGHNCDRRVQLAVQYEIYHISREGMDTLTCGESARTCTQVSYLRYRQ